MGFPIVTERTDKTRQNLSNNRFHNIGHQVVQRVIPERQESKEVGPMVALLPAWRDFLGYSAGRPIGHLLPIEKSREGMEAQRSSNSSYIHSAIYGNVRF